VEDIKKGFASTFSYIDPETGTKYKAAMQVEMIDRPKDYLHGFYLELYDAKTDKEGLETGLARGTNTQNNFIRVSITEDGKARTQAQINRTANHEAGHTLSLKHPWEETNIYGLKQGLTVPWQIDNIIKNNLMNTGRNPIFRLKGNKGTLLTPGQRKQIDEELKK
jgi:hypothetical protein